LTIGGQLGFEKAQEITDEDFPSFGANHARSNRGASRKSLAQGWLVVLDCDWLLAAACERHRRHSPNFFLDSSLAPIVHEHIFALSIYLGDKEYHKTLHLGYDLWWPSVL